MLFLASARTLSADTNTVPEDVWSVVSQAQSITVATVRRIGSQYERLGEYEKHINGLALTDWRVGIRNFVRMESKVLLGARQVVLEQEPDAGWARCANVCNQRIGASV